MRGLQSKTFTSYVASYGEFFFFAKVIRGPHPLEVLYVDSLFKQEKGKTHGRSQISIWDSSIFVIILLWADTAQ